MSFSYSYLTNYFSTTSPEKVVTLLNNKIMYLVGIHAVLEDYRDYPSTIKVVHIKTLIGICKQIQKAISQENVYLKDNYSVVYNLKEFVDVVTLPSITLGVIQDQLNCGMEILTQD